MEDSLIAWRLAAIWCVPPILLMLAFLYFPRFGDWIEERITKPVERVVARPYVIFLALGVAAGYFVFNSAADEADAKRWRRIAEVYEACDVGVRKACADLLEQVAMEYSMR